MPSAAAPRASAALFALGATVHGAIDSRCSIRANHGASSAAPKPAQAVRALPVRRASRRGVRNELVQLTVVPPPTQRPCRMLIALSRVSCARRIPGTAPDTRPIRACGSRRDDLQRAFLDQHDAQSGLGEDLRGGAAAGAGADDGDVRVEREVVGRRATRRSRSSRAQRLRVPDRRSRRSRRALTRAEIGHAGVADRRPRARIAVPGRERQLMERVVRSAQRPMRLSRSRARKRSTSSRDASGHDAVRPRQRPARGRRARAARTGRAARPAARGGEAARPRRSMPASVSRERVVALRVPRRQRARRASPARSRRNTRRRRRRRARAGGLRCARQEARGHERCGARPPRRRGDGMNVRRERIT